MEIAIRSCYVCVTDMARAIRFYEALLERPVKERDETYSVFEAGGFRLGLFAFRPAGEERAYGTNCLPSLELPCLWRCGVCRPRKAPRAGLSMGPGE